MDLNELEYRKPKEMISDDSVIEGENNVKTPKFWKTLVIVSVIISFLFGAIAGGIGGLYWGKSLFDNSDLMEDPEEEEESIFSQFDYSKIVINAEKNITIADLYLDDEERYYAMQLIGMELPELVYLNSNDETLSITSYKEDCFIIEFLEPDCAYCNKMITVVDEYRKAENAYPVIGLSIKEGDISKFNKEGENSFLLVQKDVNTQKLVAFIQWVPTFVYVKEGKIVYVTFGNMDGVTKFQENAEFAFE